MYETHLVFSYRIQEGRNSFIEEIEEEWKVDDECAAEGFNIVLLKDGQNF